MGEGVFILLWGLCAIYLGAFFLGLDPEHILATFGVYWTVAAILGIVILQIKRIMSSGKKNRDYVLRGSSRRTARLHRRD